MSSVSLRFNIKLFPSFSLDMVAYFEVLFIGFVDSCKDMYALSVCYTDSEAYDASDAFLWQS